MHPDWGPGLHECIMDLDCQFTGRGDDEDMYIVRFVFSFFLFNAGEDRKAERESFATGMGLFSPKGLKLGIGDEPPSLGNPNHIFTLQ